MREDYGGTPIGVKVRVQVGVRFRVGRVEYH